MRDMGPAVIDVGVCVPVSDAIVFTMGTASAGRIARAADRAVRPHPSGRGQVQIPHPDDPHERPNVGD